jgi:uncharacterized membrane protein
MILAPAASLYDYILGVHIIAVVVGFGSTFALPVMFAVAARRDPRSLPVLHRIEITIARYVVNPGLLLVILAGIYLASKGHHWSEFFVQWGLGAAIVIGAVVGGVLVPTAKRAERVAARDVAAATGAEIEMSVEYQGLVKRLTVLGSGLGVLVLLTVLFMAVKP